MTIPDETTAGPTAGDEILAATRALQQMADEHVVPRLRWSSPPQCAEEAVQAMYFRAALWIRSLAELSDAGHFQAAAAAGRSIARLFFEINLLVKQPRWFGALLAFPLVARDRENRRCAEFMGNNGDDAPAVEDSAAREQVQRLQGVYWDRQCPEHFSGMSESELAAEAGGEFARLAATYFPKLDAAGHEWLPDGEGAATETMEATLALAHLVSQRAFCEATKIVVEKLDLDEPAIVVETTHSVQETTAQLLGTID